MASNISSTNFRLPTFQGTQAEANASVKKIRNGLMEMDLVGKESKPAWISLERVNRTGTKSSFKISSFSQPEERKMQTAFYVSSLIEALYPTPSEEQKNIKAEFAAYLNSDFETSRETKNPGDISGKRLLTYLNNLNLARLEKEAVEAGAALGALPFAEDKPEKINGSLSTFLTSKKVELHRLDKLGEGNFGIVVSANVNGEEGKYVYKIEKRDVSKALTGRSPSFWREGDCAAARLHDVSHMPKPLFFIFRVCRENQPIELHYVPAHHVKAFGMKLPAKTTVFLEGQLMKRAAGESLDKIILRKPTILSPINGKHFTNIVRGLFNIVQKLQSHNLVHRDLKPENIFYNPQTGEVALLDFGSATKLRKKEKENDGSHLHEPTSRELAGTPKYISPRVLQQKPYGSEVDLFSFAMTILELIDKDDFRKFVEARFSGVVQGDMSDNQFATCQPTEYLNRLLETISNKKPQLQSSSMPEQSSFMRPLFGSSGSDNTPTPSNRRVRAQSMESMGVSSPIPGGGSKIERALNRHPTVKQIINLAFQASGGGTAGKVAYEQLQQLPYFQTENSLST